MYCVLALQRKTNGWGDKTKAWFNEKHITTHEKRKLFIFFFLFLIVNTQQQEADVVFSEDVKNQQIPIESENLDAS